MSAMRTLAFLLSLVAATGAQSPPSATPFVLSGATVYDGTAAPAIADAAVVVRDGKIAAVGPRREIEVPAGATVVDCTGRFLVPGLIDTHVHYSQTGWADGRPDACDVRDQYPYPAAMADNELHPERFHRAFLACGVTAVFDVGGYPWTRRLGAATEACALAPHVVASGALLTTWEPQILGLPDQRQFVLIQDEAGARAAVQAHHAAGSAAIKVWYIERADLPAEQTAPLVQAVGAATRAVGLPLIVHATSLQTARIAVAAGARLLVHSVEDREVDDEFVTACLAQQTLYCPTLTVRDGYRQLYAGEVSDEVEAQLAFVHPSIAARVRATADLPRRVSPTVRKRLDERAAAARQVMAANLRRLHDAGVRIVMGTDAGNPLTLHGPSVFVEMEAMQACGLSARAVLTAATADAALALGRSADLGRIAKGYVADLVVLAEDPGADIKAMRSITQVCRAGTLHPRAELAPR